MPTTSLRRIFILVAFISLFVSYLGFWFRFINDPVERTGSDFVGFYSVGRVAQNQGAAHAYNPLLQQQIQEQLVGFSLAPGQVLLNQHLPFLIPILQVITGPDYMLSFYKWIFLMILLYSASITILVRAPGKPRLDRNSEILIALGGILFYPFFFSLLNGQDTALLVLGASIWVFGLLSGKELIAGLGLSLATVRPHIVLVLALPMLFRHRKVFWGFTLGSGVLALISYLILGSNGVREFINVLLISAEGTWYGLNENAMFNLIGLLLRALPWLSVDIIHLVGWTIYGITVIGVCVLWNRNRDLQDGRIGLTITLALFVAPHLHFHDLTLLIIPIYELIRISKEAGNLKPSIAIMMPIAISLLLLISNISYYLQYTTPYLIIFILAVYPFYQRFKMPVHVSDSVNT